VVGAIALLPLAAVLAVDDAGIVLERATAVPWAVALGVSLAAAALGGGATLALVAGMALWIALGPRGLAAGRWSDAGTYLWFAAAALGVVVWGFRRRVPRAINVGVAGFALTVGVFYFSNVMDRLGRSASLVGLGALFLGGGSLLERARRRLVAGTRDAGGGGA
jgi:hypothetical protein